MRLISSHDSNIVTTSTSCEFDCIFTCNLGNWTKDGWIHYRTKGNKPNEISKKLFWRFMMLSFLVCDCITLSLLNWFMQLDDLEKIGLSSKQVMTCIIFSILNWEELKWSDMNSEDSCIGLILASDWGLCKYSLSNCELWSDNEECAYIHYRYTTYSGGLQEECWDEIDLLCNTLLLRECAGEKLVLARTYVTNL